MQRKKHIQPREKNGNHLKLPDEWGVQSHLAKKSLANLSQDMIADN